MKINSDHSPTLFLIILKNHLIQFQKVIFFKRIIQKSNNKKRESFHKLKWLPSWIGWLRHHGIFSNNSIHY